MIEYVIAENPDDRILARAKATIGNEGLLVFPSDTNWVVTCDPFCKKAVDRLYRLKNLPKIHHFSLLCEGFSQASSVALTEDSAFRLIKPHIPGSYTFIFEANKKLRKSLKASKTDRQVGIRFSPNHFVQKLLKTLQVPLISTHLDPELLGLNADDLLYGQIIEDEGKALFDLILDPGEYQFLGPSSVIDMTLFPPEVIREGTGEISVFGL